MSSDTYDSDNDTGEDIVLQRGVISGESESSVSTVSDETTISTATLVEPVEAVERSLLDENDQRIADECGEEWALNLRKHSAEEEYAEYELRDHFMDTIPEGRRSGADKRICKLGLLKYLRRTGRIEEDMWKTNSNKILEELMSW